MVIKSGKMQGPLFAIGPGLEQWTEIESVPELEDILNLMRGIEKTQLSDKRKGQRAELIAVVRFHFKEDPPQTNHIGICRDLSTGGMMIISQHLPPRDAAIAQIEIHPEEESTVEPFAATGVVRHILDDKSGFSIEFAHIPNKAIQQIEQHIKIQTKG
jgi:hypothetical protein